MDTFTIGVGRSWWIRVFSGNPLVRRCDRIEAWLLGIAALLLVVAIPVTGALGTSVYDARYRQYAEEGEHRHLVIATAVDRGFVVAEPNYVSFTARASWKANGREHVDVVKWHELAKVGDQQNIWVGDDGRHARAPRSPSRAAADAVGLALVVWFAACAIFAGLLLTVRWRLDARRYAAWDLEFKELAEGGRRRNGQ